MSYECQIVVDFEFNPTDREYRGLLRNEIIEIGAIKLNSCLEEIGRFSCLVKPEFAAHIDSRITKLTGIRDEDVREAACFADALQLFAAWAGPARCRVLSWSDSDLIQLEDECWAKEIEFPAVFSRWMDFQLVWQRIIHYPARMRLSLKMAADMAKLGQDSRLAHRALYDTEITTQLLRLTRDREYIRDVAVAKSLVSTEVHHSSCSIGAACGDALSSLMARLQTA